MRCVIGPKKVRRLAKRTGLPVVRAMTRGGTDHRIDLFLGDGRTMMLWPTGELRERCRDCNGMGRVPANNWSRCVACSGDGSIPAGEVAT